MIYFLATRRNSHPIKNLLRSSGRHFVDRIRIIYFEDLSPLRNLQAGTFIFSDFDFLLPEQLDVVKKIYDQIRQHYPYLKLFNDPGKVLLRYDLLKKMHALGMNKFNVARASASFEHLHLPVFIREANRHKGPLTKLIQSFSEVHKNIRLLKLLGYPPSDLLVVEYVDVSDGDGIYNKYSAFMLGETVMPRYLNYKHNWMVKSNLDPNDELMQSKQKDVEKYMRDNPHAEWVQKIFELAGITYGRADYSFANHEPQLWEINLNPAFVQPPRKRKNDNSQQRLMRDLFYQQFFEELEKIDFKSNELVQVSISNEDLAKMKLSFSQRLKEGFHNKLMKKRLHYKLLRFICFSWARMIVSMQYVIPAHRGNE
jgi:hypothetical protein